MTSLIKVILFIVIYSFAGYAQISITSANFSYTQDFNSLNYSFGPHSWTNNSTIPGWHLYIQGLILQYTGNDGSSSASGIKSFGSASATDRSLGSVSTNNIYWGVNFVNNSGSTITLIPIEYTGEQWRVVNMPVQYLDFAYSLDATYLEDPNASWTTIEVMRFNSPQTNQSPAIPLNGNLLANSETKSTSIISNLQSGESIWFRWQRNSSVTPWHGLGIDDFKFNPNGSTLPVELSSLTAFATGNTVKLNWTTETEVNNYGFEVERCVLSAECQAWNTIGFVPGNGNSNSQKNYSFIDENTSGESGFQYRLKQIDNDGQFEYSKIVEVSLFKPVDFSLKQNYPNPFNPSTSIQYTIGSRQFVQLKVYDVLGNEIAALVDEYKPEGMYDVQFTMNNLASGIYFYQLRAGNFLETKKMVITK